MATQYPIVFERFGHASERGTVAAGSAYDPVPSHQRRPEGRVLLPGRPRDGHGHRVQALFIAGLAFAEQATLLVAAKLGILGASLIAGLGGRLSSCGSRRQV